MQANWLAVVEPSIRKIYESVNSDGEGGLGGGVQRSGENRVEDGGIVCLFGGCMGNRGAAAISMLMLSRDLMWLPD